MAIEFYKEFGEFGYLANYSEYGFYKNGKYFKTAEHYYQSEKFDDLEIKNKIINASTAKEAAAIGRDRKNKRIDNFREIKLGVMYEGVLEKFRQNSDIRSKLIEARNVEIKEMTVKESFWGMGPNLDGENHMGKILEVVREKVKREVLLKILSNCRDKKVYVVGHNNPDPDTVFSSLIMTNILRSKGIEAVFSVRDENFVSKELITDYLKEDYEVIDDYSNKYFLLIDNNSLDFIESNQVLGSIDHHKITGEVEDLIEIEYASTGLLIYDLFKNSYKFSEEELKLIFLTVLADTEYLVSSRFSLEDEKLFNELGVELDVVSLQKKYFKTTDFSNSIHSNFKNDYKVYNRGDIAIRRSMISSYSLEKDKYYDEYVAMMDKNEIDLLIWCDYSLKKTYIHYKNLDIEFPYFTTSSNLIFDYLEKESSL